MRTPPPKLPIVNMGALPLPPDNLNYAYRPRSRIIKITKGNRVTNTPGFIHREDERLPRVIPVMPKGSE
ncbi:hypothetical protein Y032_0035g3141 [Ancylostoma ceylanicum]|uniref:Uncharacterized protein n=1 Tax=Ancylostoma ceylanicum TaxID=53326 RepID=A0A016UL35_9BILA|nr:hypothetical protein Y032_0035g3141 [Ancylostoma ceylanicum]